MQYTIRFALTIILVAAFSQSNTAQIELTETNGTVVITFDATIQGVAGGTFRGAGFVQAPADGQLDSDAWAIEGFSDGPLVFGGTVTAGDLARGETDGGGESTGGLYALSASPDGQGASLILQPGGSDVTPGSITLRIVNSDAQKFLTSLTVSFDIYERNDGNRSTSLRFSYSTDGQNFTDLPGLDHLTTETSASKPSFVRAGGTAPSRTALIEGISIAPNGGEFFLRWDTDDASGTGSRDELGIDNIAVTGGFLGPTASRGVIYGRALTKEGIPISHAVVILNGGTGGEQRFAVTNSFGRFRFDDLPVGETYLLQISSGRFFFENPLLAVSLLSDRSEAEFRGIHF